MKPSSIRSYLFVPGNRADRFDKACAAGADAVIVDLKDAVALDEKSAARAAVDDWLSPATPVYLRINGADTEWFESDLALCGRAGVAGVILPKSERRDDLERVMQAGAPCILPLIETGAGFAAAEGIAAVRGVRRLLFGSIDFQLDMGIDGEGDPLLYFRSHLVLVSRLARIEAPVDGVTTAIDDDAQVFKDSARARALGFGAKLCIHPRQVAHVHAAFAPTEAEIAQARRVVDAADAANGAAVALDGRMVDRPVILKAQAILAEAGRRRGTPQ
ncbi:MAG TPA: CoA ester lyase [Noviherbaspirillum sp.]|jgi:citrate lyase subunit beta/citryl-CoA lyase|uniref:HpcH/HpaI aldolase/citrate lyase family protein n=1 Tax=Noviherbaspirillum sp. TaxID=1926288 RepID=UPI002F92348C